MEKEDIKKIIEDTKQTIKLIEKDKNYCEAEKIPLIYNLKKEIKELEKYL